MKIGLLIIATEVLEGKIVDQNTKILADQLKNHHFEINNSLTVRDDDSEIQAGAKNILDKCDVLITAGGLGPTKDDITKSSLASLLGRKIIYSPSSEEITKKHYQRFNRPIPAKDHGYNFLIEGFEPLHNATGFAPGFYGEHLGKYIICFPGVPRELKSMIEEHLETKILNHSKRKTLNKNIIARTMRVPEEKIFNEIDKELWDKLTALGSVSSLPIVYGVDIGVKISASSLTELNAKEAQVKEIFNQSPVRPFIWSFGTESVEELIVKKAIEKKLTFGFAESCTGGLCSHRITAVPGSSQCFMGSVISYDSEVKINLLDVKKETIDQFNVVSTQVATEMAQGLKNKLKVDIALSTTGIAGPSGGSPELPVGTICIGHSLKTISEAEKLNFFGDRETLRNRFTQATLYKLLEFVENFA